MLASPLRQAFNNSKVYRTPGEVVPVAGDREELVVSVFPGGTFTNEAPRAGLLAELLMGERPPHSSAPTLGRNPLPCTACPNVAVLVTLVKTFTILPRVVVIFSFKQKQQDKLVVK